jgi:glucose/arabinose dehydrogenase
MDRRTLLTAGLLTPAALALPAAGGLAEARPRIGRVLASGLDVPWGIAFLPSGDALVSERDTGRVVKVRAGGGQRVVGHVPGVVPNVSQGGEGGLLGLALHPDFARNRWLYAYLSSRTDNRVVRMRYANGRLGEPHVIVQGIAKSVHHNGGGLAFGAGGRLFISTGDAENPANAQRKGSRSGKILRVNADGSVPPSNPFGSRVWSYGHRNPEGIAFGPNGDLWASEFGQDTWDELNLIRKGHNYGWPRQEGKDGPGGFHDPLAQWNPDNCSPSGIAIARGHAWLGALRGECLWSVQLSGPHRGRKVRHLHGRLGRIRAVAKAPDGSLWVGTSNRDGRATPGPRDDRIVRVTFR